MSPTRRATTSRGCAAAISSRLARPPRTGHRRPKTMPAPQATSTSTARPMAWRSPTSCSGRRRSCDTGAPGILDMNQWYVGAYGQDTWRIKDRVTLNMGLRWEPYFGQNVENGAIANFVLDNFRNGTKTQRFKNAPA